MLYIESACNLAVEQQLITSNPYKGLARGTRKARKKADDIKPFSRAERDAILEAFSRHQVYCHYYHFIKFLFLTGCRTGEAAGLQWKHVATDNSFILFSETHSHRTKLNKPTKNGKVRKFPCNAAARSLLVHLRDKAPTPMKQDALVFRTLKSHAIDNDQASSRTGWRKIVEQLVAD